MRCGIVVCHPKTSDARYVLGMGQQKIGCFEVNKAVPVNCAAAPRSASPPAAEGGGKPKAHGRILKLIRIGARGLPFCTSLIIAACGIQYCPMLLHSKVNHQ